MMIELLTLKFKLAKGLNEPRSGGRIYPTVKRVPSYRDERKPGDLES